MLWWKAEENLLTKWAPSFFSFFFFAAAARGEAALLLLAFSVSFFRHARASRSRRWDRLAGRLIDGATCLGAARQTFCRNRVPAFTGASCCSRGFACTFARTATVIMQPHNIRTRLNSKYASFSWQKIGKRKHLNHGLLTASVVCLARAF